MLNSQDTSFFIARTSLFFASIFNLVGIGFALYSISEELIPKENTKSEPVSHREEPVRILCVWYG